MWRELFAVVSAILLQYIATHMYVSKSGVQVDYHVTFSHGCEISEQRFQMILGQSLSDCVIECALREHCAVMNYQSAMTLCELYHIKEEEHIDDTVTHSSHRCIRVLKNDIRLIKSPCHDNNACPNGTACDRATGTCLNKECLEAPQVENGQLFGNRRNVGSRIRYKCNKGYKFSVRPMEAVCIDGQWNNSGQCLPAINVGEMCMEMVCFDDNARCVEKNGTHKYCHCKFGFGFDETSSTCVKVCNQYSDDPSIFKEITLKRLKGYHGSTSKNMTYLTFTGCAYFCVQTYPEFLSINFRPGHCLCKSIAQQQYIKTHGDLPPSKTADKHLYDRPCVN